MRKLQVAAMAAGMILLAGCGQKAADNAGDSGGKQQETKAETKEQKGGIITSIKDAMGLGQTMKCIYTDNFDGKTVVSETYVNGDNFYTSNDVEGKKMISLFNGKVIYSWTEGEKKGTMMDVKCFDDMPKPDKQEPDNGLPTPPEEKVNPREEFDNATDVKCEPASGIDFDPPKDITFSDQCAAMKEMLNKMKDIKVPTDKLPKDLPVDMPTSIPPSNLP